MHSYVSILEKNDLIKVSPTQTSRHAIERRKINLFSQFLDLIRKTLTDNELSQMKKMDLQRILAWFMIDYFQHNLDLISQARKNL